MEIKGIDKYYLFERNAHGGNSYKTYTLEELKGKFEPMRNEDNDMKTMFDSINNIDSLRQYIEKFINNRNGIHYHDYYIEEF